MVPRDHALDAPLPDLAPAALDAFGVLADEQRRFVLYYLREHQRSTVDELADVLGGWSSVDGRSLSTPADATVFGSASTTFTSLGSKTTRSSPTTGRAGQ